MEVVILWLIFAMGVGALASNRGRSGWGFFLLSVVLSPLIGLIVVLVTADLNAVKAAEKQRKADEEMAERLRREEHERQLASIQALAASRPRGPALEPGASLADELSKLAKLRDEGVLTPEEFTTQKARLLGAEPASAPPAAAEEAPASSKSVEFGICPNCDSTIPLLSEKCERCNALFGPGSSWAVRRIGAT